MINLQNTPVDKSWKSIIENEFSKTYFKKLNNFLSEENKKFDIYPPEKDIFNAFKLTPFEQVKVVIIGQDPYHGEGQAHGLCFSVQNGIKIPPSLRNIFKEINAEFDFMIPSCGNLEKWAKQGVLLLNATLTVRSNKAGSHQKKGWETFTDAIISKISQEKSGIVFLLWGNYAINKAQLIDKNKHHILTAAHPSPLSAHRGFFGCNHFAQTNELLSKEGKQAIDWNLCL